MPQCPNCSYDLVLREWSRKYKCSKCGRLYSQIKIDAKEFREQNKRERQKGKLESLREARREANEKFKLKNPEKLKIYSKIYYNKNKETIKKRNREWAKNNKNKILGYQKEYLDKNSNSLSIRNRKYYQNHKETILVKQAKYRAESGQKRNSNIRNSYHKDIDASRLKARIKYWRNQQKALAVQMQENGFITPYNSSFSSSLLT